MKFIPKVAGLAVAAPSSAAKELGGVNIQRWCASTQHAVLATT